MDKEKENVVTVNETEEKVGKPSRKSLLSTLNSEYRSNRGNSPAKRTKLDAVSKLKKLEQLKADERSFNMFADYSDTQSGDLYHYDDLGIRYMLSADEIKKLFSSYEPYGNSYLLGADFKVKIEDIDYNESLVKLSAISCSMSDDLYRKMDTREGRSEGQAIRLSRVLHNSLKSENGKRALVRGRVVNVEKDRIYINIFDTGLIGVVPVKNYMEQYRRDLRNCVQVDDELKGVVIAYRARKDSDETAHFIISTADHVADPWLKAKNLKVRDLIIVKCIEKVDAPFAKRQYFWGSSNTLPNIDIMGDFTTKVPASALIEGHSYKCKITQIDIRQHKIKVSPFAEVSASGNEFDNL